MGIKAASMSDLTCKTRARGKWLRIWGKGCCSCNHGITSRCKNCNNYEMEYDDKIFVFYYFK